MPHTETLPPRLLTEDDVARMTGLTNDTLRTWRCKRKGPAYRKLGSRVLYDEADVAAWIAAQPRFHHAA